MRTAPPPTSITTRRSTHYGVYHLLTFVALTRFQFAGWRGKLYLAPRLQRAFEGEKHGRLRQHHLRNKRKTGLRDDKQAGPSQCHRPEYEPRVTRCFRGVQV